MRRIVLLGTLLLLALVPAVQGEEEIGAFFTTVNAYAYPDGPKKGRRVLLRPRKAFAVVNVTTDAEERVWLRLVYPKRERKLKGEGWTPLAPHELLSTSKRPVKVFTEIVDSEEGPVNSVVVPTTGLELLNVTQAGERFPRLTWQKVRYETSAPLRLWIQAVTGIYRPGRSAQFVARAYVEMVSRNLPKDKLERLISGVIRVGDSPWEVEHALGEPLRVHEEPSGETRRTTWEYPSLVVLFKNEVVEQIN